MIPADSFVLLVDLEELLDLVKSSPVGTMIRPSKTRKMFASRACRMSVMIGKALNVNQMTTVRSLPLSSFLPHYCSLIHFRLTTDTTAYGNDESAMGVSARKTDYAMDVES